MSCWISESEESGCDVRKEGKERERRGKGEGKERKEIQT